jgi:hypothetical protein
MLIRSGWEQVALVLLEEAPSMEGGVGGLSGRAQRSVLSGRHSTMGFALE